MSRSSHGAPRTTRPKTVLAAGLVLLMSLATAATAQNPIAQEGVNLRLNVGGVGSRALAITDVAGRTLTDLTLISGQGANYRATVTDLDYLVGVGSGFDLISETGNLYPVVPGATLAVDASGAQIDSQNVGLSLAQGLTTSNILADLNPQFLLSLVSGLTEGACNTALDALTPVTDALAGLDAATALLLNGQIDAVCAQVGALSAGDVTALNGLPIPATPIDDLDLTALLDSLLTLTDGTGGSYTVPSFLGLGTDDGEKGTLGDPTSVSLMLANVPTAVSQALIDAINAALAGANLDTGGKEVTQVIAAADALTALAAQSAGTALSNAIGAVNNAAAQEAIINELLSIANGAIDLSILDGLVGAYTAYPVLTATAPVGTAPGAYAGTHTVTLVSK